VSDDAPAISKDNNGYICSPADMHLFSQELHYNENPGWDSKSL